MSNSCCPTSARASPRPRSSPGRSRSATSSRSTTSSSRSRPPSRSSSCRRRTPARSRRCSSPRARWSPSARRSSRSATRAAAPAAPQTESDPCLGMARRRAARRARSTSAEIDLSNPRRLRRRRGRVAWSAATRPTAARCAAPARAGLAAHEAGAETQLQVQGAFAPGGAQSGRGRAGRRVAVPPSTSARAGRRPPRRSSRRRADRPSDVARWPSRRCASSPRTSASTSPTLTGSGAGGVDHPRRRRRRRPPRCAVELRRSRGDASRGQPTGERETREPIKGVRKMMAQAMSQSAFTARTSPSGSPST